MSENHESAQVTTWEKIRYAMDRWGLPVVALAVVSTLFWRNMNSQDEFARQTLLQQGQAIQLATEMHEDHKRIISIQETMATATTDQTSLLAEANRLLQKINDEQHGRDK